MSAIPSSPARPVAIDLVVFDWDGTLVDSTGAIVESIQGAARDLGLPVPSRERAAWVIGLGLQEASHTAVPELRHDQLPAFVERYRAHWLARHEAIFPFDGVPGLLARLAAGGSLLAVATGKSRAGLDRALGQTGWDRLFDATRTADEGVPKPDPWMLVDLCEQLGIEPARAIMIGDTTHDLGMARAAGSAFVGVTYGAHRREQLLAEGAATLVDDVAALAAALESLGARIAPEAPGPSPTPNPTPPDA